MKEFLKRAKEWLGMAEVNLTAPPDVKAMLYLYLGDLLVGTLSVTNGLWRFKYSDEFKGARTFRPLIEFPELDGEYESEELWQFFASRIPNTLQPDIEDVLRNEKIDETSVLALLKRFGGRTITNPYELRTEPIQSNFQPV